MTKARDLADIIDSNGVDVTGTVTADGLNVSASLASADLSYLNNTNSTQSDVLRLNTAGVGVGTNILDVQSGDTTRFLVRGDGNVGIATTSPFSTISTSVGANAPSTSGNMSAHGATIHNGSGGRAVQIGVNESGAYNYIQSSYVNNANTGVDLAFFTGATERMRVSSSGTVTVSSEGGAATTSVQQGLCKQWINFNGGGAVSIRDSFNTTSITDNGTGNYTVTIANDMASSNWSVFLQADFNDAAGTIYTNNPDIFSSATGSYGVGTYDNNNFANFFQIRSGLVGDLA